MLFSLYLEFLVLAGLTCVVTGAVTGLSKKRRGRHARWGTIYYWSFSVMFVSATGLAVLHWTTDVYLFVIGAVAFGYASSGYWVLALHLQRRIGTRSAHAVHSTGMGFSYIALLTAFYVDNEPHLPVLRQLPHLSLAAAECDRVAARSSCSFPVHPAKRQSDNGRA